MSNLFIYASNYSLRHKNGDLINKTVTVIFCESSQFNLLEVQSEIKAYYNHNYQTDEILIICGKHNLPKAKEIFIEKKQDAFKDIPKLEISHLSDHLYLFAFNSNGELGIEFGTSTLNFELQKIVCDGLISVFEKRGGLIEANGNAHHFVFPSGKHSNKFLRTGNILLHSAEIYFIAFTLLSRYNEKKQKKVFCDTSSINTIALALLDLKRKTSSGFIAPSITSFSSYDGLLSGKYKFYEDCLILISSSTSGNIIGKIKQKNGRVLDENIVILYFLGPSNHYLTHKDRILCNLTYSTENQKGISSYDTFSEKDCVYCMRGSYAVEVTGDVFLLEKPNIRRVVLNVTDAPKGLSKFVQQFISEERIKKNILKVNYKDSNIANNNIKYEVFFDMSQVIDEVDRYGDFKERLDDYINQYIPSNVRYFLCLPDEGSNKLGTYILGRISGNYNNANIPKLLSFDQIDRIEKDTDGAVVIVASCIANGKNLLFISRTLRNYEKLRLLYFVGLTTTTDEDYRNFLISNLGLGKHGKNTNSFIDVYNFYCNKDSKNTSWISEKNFLKDLIFFLESRGGDFNLTTINDRIELIDQSMSFTERGLANQLFYPTTCNQQLELRKGFAFFNTFNDYVKNVSQADVYFTISAVINSLRYSKSQKQTLNQTEFVRNLIDPGNFNRYNDGVIQASILRSAYSKELCYHIDEAMSRDMYSILEKIAKEHGTEQGEGLIEFIYAIASQKLTLKNYHLESLVEILNNIDNEYVKAFNSFIKKSILISESSLAEKNNELENRISELTKELESLKKM